ncbi:hypothetical protein TrVE_jg11985 [Triparma verrucosa]|uniref:FAD/NAD(P)-binding domain-containing protein n=1 Tax=Triparma verrucosa TaxID=1606542 RepID=A0A9W7F4Z0_9STRA|nr:hypothetical protein TrVE_jg11985 [Triparma verrucosa]
MPMPSVTIIGAGPIGLEMACRCVSSNFSVTLIEKEPTIAGNVHKWSSVNLFSPWSMNYSPRGLEILTELKVDHPKPDSYPTGKEYVEEYLDHIKSYLCSNACPNFNLKLSATLISSVRQNSPKTSMSSRSSSPFLLLLKDSNTNVEFHHKTDKLIDCSGTYSNPSPLGLSSQPALNERSLNSEITRSLNAEIPVGSKILLVGSGATAITFLKKIVEACENADNDVQTEVIWLTRRGKDKIYHRIPSDPLPQRDNLSVLAHTLLLNGGSKNLKLTHLQSEILSLSKSSDQWTVGLTSPTSPTVTCLTIIGATGFRPDTSIYSELQVHTCYASEGPMKLAGYLLSQSGGGGGDCLSQVSPGPELLRNPEEDFYVAGMKSYGRGSAFLIRIGLEQVDMIMGLLQGK